LKRCLEYTQGKGIGCTKLDATPAGKQVYDTLGFVDEWALTRWEHAAFNGATQAGPSRLRPLRCEDLVRCEALDTRAFGVTRIRLIEALIEQSATALIRQAAGGEVAGYGLLRRGARANYLGPVVARDAEVGLELVAGLLAEARGAPIFWDIPDSNGSAAAWARQQGFTPQRMLTRMYRGQNANPGEPGKMFGITGPETG
jgi:hypothetical protein